jgi:hypothetical protein
MRTLKDKVIEDKAGRSSFKYVSSSLIQSTCLTILAL